MKSRCKSLGTTANTRVLCWISKGSGDLRGFTENRVAYPGYGFMMTHECMLIVLNTSRLLVCQA